MSKKENNQKNINEEDVKYDILEENDSSYDISFKIIVVGNSGVGKSCISLKAIKNIFECNYTATVGF